MSTERSLKGSSLTSTKAVAEVNAATAVLELLAGGAVVAVENAWKEADTVTDPGATASKVRHFWCQQGRLLLPKLPPPPNSSAVAAASAANLATAASLE